MRFIYRSMFGSCVCNSSLFRYDSDSEMSDDHDDPSHVCTTSAHTLRAGVPLYKYKHDKLNQMYRNRLQRQISASEMRSNEQHTNDLRLDTGYERDRRASSGRRQNGVASNGEDSVGAGGSDGDSEVHIIDSERLRREKHLRGRSRTENGVGGRDIYLHFSDDEDAGGYHFFRREVLGRGLCV